jgi:quercetin dioxygenase-like cupin family protein
MPGFTGSSIHSDNMTVVDWKITEGSSFAEHTHPHEQIAFILEGRFELSLEGESQILEPGMVAVIPSNAPHGGKALTDCRLIDMFCPVREDFRQLSETEK